jgi:hypothetical protein
MGGDHFINQHKTKKNIPMKPNLVKTIVGTTLLFQLATCNLRLATAATIIGNLQDISQQSLDTRISFAPTNQVLVTGGGLSVGPPRIIDSASGAFSIVLEAGDYTVSLPLLGWRKPFVISVLNTNGTVNITNLPISYPFPDHHPLHVNAVAVNAWSTNGATSLLDETMSFPAGSLRPRNIISVEAFGSFVDPGGNGPSVTFTLRFGGTTIVTRTEPIQVCAWHLSALVTVRATGAAGSVAGALALEQDSGSTSIFPFGTQTAVVDMTTALNLDLVASIQDFSGTERVICEQMFVRTP